jgi:hypothetical protein
MKLPNQNSFDEAGASHSTTGVIATKPSARPPARRLREGCEKEKVIATLEERGDKLERALRALKALTTESES